MDALRKLALEFEKNPVRAGKALGLTPSFPGKLRGHGSIRGSGCCNADGCRGGDTCRQNRFMAAMEFIEQGEK